MLCCFVMPSICFYIGTVGPNLTYVCFARLICCSNNIIVHACMQELPSEHLDSYYNSLDKLVLNIIIYIYQ